MLAPRFMNQAGTAFIQTPGGVSFAVERLSMANEGGPYAAVVTATGRTDSILALMGLLRAPIEIVNGYGDLCWWGYVNRISVQIRKAQIAVSMDEVANRVALAYTQVTGTNGQYGVRATTSWLDDTDSQAQYGIRELLSSGANYTAAQADAVVADLLATLGKPALERRFGGDSMREGYASLTFQCYGWYRTLGWRYYTNTAGFVDYSDIGYGLQALGKDASTLAVRQGFQIVGSTAWAATKIRFRAKKIGTPVTNMTVGIATGAGNLADMVQLIDITPANTPTSLDWVEVTIPAMTLSPATTYYLIVKQVTALATNYYQVDVNEKLGFSSGNFRVWNGSSWVARSVDADMVFQITGVAETTAQMVKVITATGQFMSGSVVMDASGVSSAEWQPNLTDGQTMMASLLATPTSASKRLRAHVTPGRIVVVEKEPDLSWDTAYSMTADGTLLNISGGLILPERTPVGVWALLRDGLPDFVNLAYLTNGRYVFIEGMEYDAITGRVSLQQRNSSAAVDLKILRRG